MSGLTKTQATHNSRKLRKDVLKSTVPPGQALYERFTIKMYRRFQSIFPSNFYVARLHMSCRYSKA